MLPRSLHADRKQWYAETFGVPLALSGFICVYSVWLGVDATWDLRNYHLYNPFALLHKAEGRDIAAAQMQSYLSPFYDLLLQVIRNALSEWPTTLCAVFAIPSAIAAILTFRIGLTLFPEVDSRRWWSAPWVSVSILTLYGLTGAAGLSTTGSAMSEMPSTCFILGSLLVMLMHTRAGRISVLACLGAGMLGGIAVGIKLTSATFLIALLAGGLIATGDSLRARLNFAILYSTGAAVGLLAIGGPWFVHLYLETGNPVFPFYNQIFHSPLYPLIAGTDERFKPHGVLQTLLYPAYWAFRSSELVAESSVRDPRMLLSLCGAFAMVCVVARDRMVRGLNSMDDGERRNLLIALFVLLGYALWENQFSILRYLVPVEVVGGLPLLALIKRLAGRFSAGSTVALLGMTAGIIAFTGYPQWGRIPQEVLVYRTVLPPLGRDDMVLILSDEPMAFLATFADPAVRFIGANNKLVTPGLQSGLAMRVEQAVRDHRGKLWGLEATKEADRSEEALAYYRIHRSDWCEPVSSNLLRKPVRMCVLERD